MDVDLSNIATPLMVCAGMSFFYYRVYRWFEKDRERLEGLEDQLKILEKAELKRDSKRAKNREVIYQKVVKEDRSALRAGWGIK